MEWTLKIKGLELNEWAWWNTSWTNRRNITFSDALTPDINRTGEIILLNITGLTLNTNNCTELALLNDTESQINYNVESNGTTIPPQGQKWCKITFELYKNDTVGDINYTVYYGSTSLSNNNPQGNLVRKSGSPSDNNVTYNATWWDGIWSNVSGGTFKLLRDKNTKQWSDPAPQVNHVWQFINFLSKNTTLADYVRIDSYNLPGNANHQGCNPVYCMVDAYTDQNIFFNITLYSHYLKYEGHIIDNQTQANYSAVLFSNLNGSGHPQVCDYFGGCTSAPNGEFPNTADFYFFNVSGYNIGAFIFQNNTGENRTMSHQDSDGVQLYSPVKQVQTPPHRIGSLRTTYWFGFADTYAQTDHLKMRPYANMLRSPVNSSFGTEETINSITITDFRTAQVLEEVDFVKDKTTLARVCDIKLTL